MENQVANNANSATPKIKVKEIYLHRAEGREAEKTLVASGVNNIWEEAKEVLSIWAETAPVGAYDKVYFKITWDDEETFGDRYDLTRSHTVDADLAKNVKSNFMFYLEKPKGIPQERYDLIVEDAKAENPSLIAYCQTMIDAYDMYW